MKLSLDFVFFWEEIQIWPFHVAILVEKVKMSERYRGHPIGSFFPKQS